MSVTSKQASSGSYLMPSLEHAAVSDAMHPGVMACDADASMTTVARMMASHHVHCVVVMDQSTDHQPIAGLITDLDLLAASLTQAGDTPAAELAQAEFLTIRSTTPLRDAAEVMTTNRVSHVLVTDARTNIPTGMLSTLDIAGVVAWGEA